MKLVSDLKQFLILNDFPSVNEAINQRNQQLRSLQEECDKKLIALRDEISIDLYELEEEYYSSRYPTGYKCHGEGVSKPGQPEDAGRQPKKKKRKKPGKQAEKVNGSSVKQVVSNTNKPTPGQKAAPQASKSSPQGVTQSRNESLVTVPEETKSNISERLSERRRGRHAEALTSMYHELACIARELEPFVLEHGKFLLTKLMESDRQIELLFKKIEFDTTLEGFSMEGLKDLWNIIHQESMTRRKWIREMDESLKMIEWSRADKITEVLRKYTVILEEISFFLSADVYRFMNDEAMMINRALLANQRAIAKLFFNLMKSEMKRELSHQLKWQDRVKDWKLIQKNSLVHSFRYPQCAVCDENTHPVRDGPAKMFGRTGVMQVELLLHKERLESHCAGVVEALKKERAEFLKFCDGQNNISKNLHSRIRDMESVFLSAPMTEKLVSFNNNLHSELHNHLEMIHVSLRSYRNYLEEALGKLRDSNVDFLRACRLFLEGGNFSPEEVKSFSSCLQEESKRIDSFERLIKTDMEKVESRCLEQEDFTPLATDVTLQGPIAVAIRKECVRDENELMVMGLDPVKYPLLNPSRMGKSALDDLSISVIKNLLE
ncbi:hypothetical protein llap_17013 [Limosa lapponica baueri]|uniref:DUF4455 domain-containing protein n=1 Tax=Limosa lapponica baueri TaxID=1758121 RepID=A0A2I0TFV1_LIMLA|nr:hypothetical protein llap_17013 [Limosa lapponica baueri]